MKSDRGLRNSSWQGASFTPVINRSFEHHAGDSTFGLGFTPNFESQEHPNHVTAGIVSPCAPSLLRSFCKIDGI
ncbi:hypothetical protein TNCV_1547291 [Trichonephila clavipes]|nr:hypothetical protein TNCV_1547291 [Trichonephila clavipes]